jgi:hypothetical protein
LICPSSNGPTARISKIFRGSRAVENPAPHRTAELECFRSIAVGLGNKSTPQTQRPTDFLQTDPEVARDLYLVCWRFLFQMQVRLS